MATKQARTKAHRRDRRRAKASNWTRQGKAGMGKRIGHGPGAAPQVEVKSGVKAKDVTKPVGKRMPSLRVRVKDAVDEIPTLPEPEPVDELDAGWQRLLDEIDFKYDLENDGSKPKPR